MVPLRHHVRGAVYFDDARCRHARRTISPSGSLGKFMATAWQYALLGRESFFECAAGRGVGLVSVSGRGRPTGRHQQSLAALRSGQSTFVRGRALSGNDDFDQDEEGEISFHYSSAALFHVRGDLFSRLSENLFCRSRNWFLERRSSARPK